MVCCGVRGRAARGVICLPAMGIGRPSTTDTGVGRRMGRGCVFWLSCAVAVIASMPMVSGRLRLTRRSFVHINTRPVRARNSHLIRTQGALANYKNLGGDREALGRSRGGLTTKIHLAADLRCRPLARVTTAGQRHDSIAFTAVMDGIDIKRWTSGRPRTRPSRVLADKAYANKTIRAHLQCRGIKATIPQPTNRLRRGRPPAFDVEIYKQRNVVERCINKLKHNRAIATRYDKRDYIWRGTIDVASIRIWLRDPVP